MGSFGIKHDAEAWQNTSINGSNIANSGEATAAAAIDLDGFLGAEVSVEVAYGGTASQGVQVYALKDVDGTNYESRSDNPWGFEMPKTVSTTHRRTFVVDARDTHSFKPHVYNPSGAQITATVRYRRFLGETA